MPSLRDKSFEFEGRFYTTRTFARAFNLPPGLIWQRVNHGIMDSRLPIEIDLNAIRHTSKIKPRRKSVPRVPMYVRTFMNGWREWEV